MAYLSHQRLLALTIIPLSILVISNSALAQRNEPDFISPLISGADCAVGGSYYSNAMEAVDESVSIGRQLRRPNFHLHARKDSFVTMSCEIDPTRYVVLNLDMGVSDGANTQDRMTVNIYQDGSIKNTYRDLTAGADFSTSLNLTGGNGAENISIELTCHDANPRCYIYGFTTELIPHPSQTSRSSMQRSQETQVSSQRSRDSAPPEPSSNRGGNESILNDAQETAEGVGTLLQTLGEIGDFLGF